MVASTYSTDVFSLVYVNVNYHYAIEYLNLTQTSGTGFKLDTIQYNLLYIYRIYMYE